ncbi:MAG: tyrosine-type recombinase/integrase [Myxococcota bacterium]|nr:tyrosine-type recombinase/integrase [Myxococcota bacterium]
MSFTIRPYRRGGWEVDIVLRMPDGERFRERIKAPVGSKSAATRWAQDRERILFLDHLERQDSKEVQEETKRAPAPTLDEFTKRFIDGHAKANRQKPSGIDAKESVIRNHLSPRFGKRPLDRIRDEDVQHLKTDLGKKSAKTVNNVLTVLNTMLKVAVRWGVIERMPARIDLLRVPPLSDPAFYDFDQYERLVRGAEQHGPRTLAAILLGGDAGLRRGEIIALEWPDLDLERGVLTVRRSEWKGQVTVPKGGRPRRIKMTDKLRQTLAALRHLRGPRVLYRDDGETVTAKVLRKWMEAAQRRANLPATGALHCLRHTFCSHLAMRGASPRAIQELAGHENITTTMRYMHLSPAVADGAIALLDGARSAQVRGDLVETGQGGQAN